MKKQVELVIEPPRRRDAAVAAPYKHKDILTEDERKERLNRFERLPLKNKYFEL